MVVKEATGPPSKYKGVKFHPERERERSHDAVIRLLALDFMRAAVGGAELEF